MPPASPDRVQPLTVATRADAERVLADLTGAMRELEFTLECETALIGAGRVRDGLATEARKGELAAAYILKLQRAKGNIVALGRLAPSALREFRTRQSEFERIVDRNQTVIATARTISEGLLRSLSDEMKRSSRPAGYGPQTRPAESATPALVFSGRF